FRVAACWMVVVLFEPRPPPRPTLFPLHDALPIWSYAVSKLFDEHLAFAYAESFGLPTTVLRFFGSYGPRQHLSWWGGPQAVFIRSEEHTSELQSLAYLVCRLLLEKKK